MPEIDVNDIVSDPFIAGEGFWVYRRLETVSSHGRVELRGSWLPAEGSITPTGDNSLVRQEAFQTQANTIQVVTNFRLRGPSRTSKGKSYQPDLVYWESDFYVVSNLEDYSKYGAGIMVAECTSIQLTDQPPPLPPGAIPGAADFSKPRNSGILGA